MHTKLDMLLFNPRRAQEALVYPSLCLGRVVLQQKDFYCVLTDAGEVTAQVSGRFRHEAVSPGDFPAVGDFVMLDGSVIQHVLPRTSALVRKAAGRTREEQVIAANVDVAFICMALDSNFNLRRLERYLTLVWDSGALPAVVLTKADLCADAPARIAVVQDCAAGVDVYTVSGLTGEGAQTLRPCIAGKTVALIGSSGVGKSTLLNCLSGGTLMDTGQTRADGKGRHTTTYRAMFPLCGGAVIDTPGMRELGLESGDFERSFSDIEALADFCRFRDCAHQTEPGCAVLEAVQRGDIPQERLASYHKLKKEAGFDGLSFRELEAKKLRAMFPHGGGTYVVKSNKNE